MIPSLEAIRDWCNDKFTLKKASSSELGGIKVGTNLSIEQDGTLSATIPMASMYNLGGIKFAYNSGCTIDENDRFLVDNAMLFNYRKYDITGDSLTAPRKVGEVIDQNDNLKDVYAVVFYKNLVRSRFYSKLARDVEDVLYYSISINDGELKEFKDFTDSESLNPNNPAIQGPKLFTYADNVGLEFILPNNRASVSAILYYTKIDLNELSFTDLFTSQTSKTITVGNVTITYENGSLTINGTTGSSDVEIYSEYSGASGSDVLPPIISTAPERSQFVSITTSERAYLDIDLYSIVNNEIKCLAKSSFLKGSTTYEPCTNQSSADTYDFVRGSLRDTVAISHIKLTLYSNRTYNNFVVEPAFKTKA